MKGSTIEVGKRRESIAAQCLKGLSYSILCTNFRARRCEIDLVAKEDGCLVFVEVKTRSNTFYNDASPSKGQIRRLLYAANSFVNTQKTSARACRFDLIRIYADKKSVKV